MVEAHVTVGVLVAILVLLMFAAFGTLLGYLHYRNGHPKPAPVSEIKRSKIVKFLRIFIFDVFLEVIGFVFFISACIGLETNNWEHLDMTKIRVAFYVLQCSKYVLLIFAVFSEHVNDELDDKITEKMARLGVRADWKEILEGLIFIPSIIVDGMLTNAEFYTDNNNALIFNNDSVVLISFDIILWLKLCMSLLLNQYSARGNPPYSVKQFAYAWITFLYTFWMVMLYIVIHARFIPITGMDVNASMIIILVNALTHNYICSYCSMMSPGIIMLDKALRGSGARVQQLKFFVRFLRIEPIAIFFTLGFFAYAGYIYISIFKISLDTATNFAQDSTILGVMYTVCIMVDIWTAFFIANAVYAFLKRMGGYFNLRSRLCSRFPDCTSYSEQINTILGQCGASFRLDTRGQIVGGGRI